MLGVSWYNFVVGCVIVCLVVFVGLMWVGYCLTCISVVCGCA